MIRRTSAILITLLLACTVLAAATQKQPPTFKPPVFTSFELLEATMRFRVLEKDKPHAVTPAQALKTLKLLKPLRSKATLTEKQSKDTLAALNKILTAAQIKASDALMAKQQAEGKQKVDAIKNGTNIHSAPPGSLNGKGTGHSTGSKMIIRSKDGAVTTMIGGPSGFNFNPFYSKSPANGLPTRDMVKNMDSFFKFLDQRAKKK